MRIFVYLIVGCMLLLSCVKEESPQLDVPGHLLLTTDVSFDVINKAAINTQDFSLIISNNGSGSVVFSGLVGQLTGALELPAGTYTINVFSAHFSVPAFSSPVYGAIRSNVVVEPNLTTTVSMECLQTNAGVLVGYTDKFMEYCQRKGYGWHTIVRAGVHTLDYGSDEVRAGYFLPGSVDVVVDLNGSIFSKTIILASQELVTVRVNITNDIPGLTHLVITITGVDDTTVSEDSFVFDEI